MEEENKYISKEKNSNKKTSPIKTTTAVKNINKSKNKLFIGGTLGCLFFVGLILFCLFAGVLLLLGIIVPSENEKAYASSYYHSECGFTLKKTSLSEKEYIEKVKEYTSKHTSLNIFGENAANIYKTATSMNLNPELVIVRAVAEGSSQTGSYNFWGIGCFNGAGISACHDYGSFEEGYTAFLTNISQYESLADMMSKYAYIGEVWLNPGSSSDGGCYYASYIYENAWPSHVQKACGPSAPSCTSKSSPTCTKTTDADQEAYATWQVKQNMGSIRKNIFGLESDEGPCVNSSGNFQSLSVYNLKHEGLSVLNRALTTTEVNNLNTYIDNEINKAGYGTGAAVAAAGQALTYGLEQLGYYLQYRWGGGHGQSFVGVNPNWGSSNFGCDVKGRCYNGMDCSGFVSWAIRTACTPTYGSNTTHSMKHGPSIDISKAKPGDLMLDADSHVRLVIKNNDDGTVIVAEESGGSSGLIFSKQTTESGYEFIDMSNYYSKNCNSSR